MAVFNGVGVALVTLFDDNGALDAGASAQHASRLVDAGLQAVIVAGTTGEAWMLSADEQRALTDAVIAAVGERVPVLVGVRGDDAVSRAQAASDAGAAAVLALSPAEDVEAYYAAVAAIEVATLAYHFPAVSPPGIPVEVLPRLPVVGMKDSSGDEERLRAEVRDWDQPVYTGASGLVQLAGELGAAGAILAIANLDPELAVAAFAGDDDAQSRLESFDIPNLKQRLADRFATSASVRA